MRILFMTQVLPFPLDAGPKIRAYHVIRYLAEAGHEIDLLSFVRPGDSEEQIGTLRRMCRSVETVPMVRSRVRDVCDGLLSVMANTPFLLLRDQLPAMRRRLHDVLGSRSFDALHADQLWMAPYGMNGVAPPLTVLDQHNAVFLIPRRLAEHHQNPVARVWLRLEAAKLQDFERKACERFNRVVWVTEEDRRAVVPGREPRPLRDSVIPIATDPSAQRRITRPRPFRVTFLGGIHWPPNKEAVDWLAEKVWPRVARAIPSAVLTVIGKSGRAALSSLQNGGRVQVTGYIRDLERYLSETSVFVVPLRSGAGMRVKILDAWCWGLPVVSTTVGAEGLKGRCGENLLICDEAGAFADAVVKLIRDRRMAARLADGGRSTVEAHYDWRRVYPAWDHVYRS